MKRTILTPEQASWLADTFERNRARFGGFRMEAEGGDAGEGSDGADAGAGDAAGSGADDKGGKPDEGKTFTQADVDRIIQGRLAKYADYDELRKQVDDLKSANQTEAEKAIEAARSEGRTEAASELSKSLAREAFDNLAGRRNPDFDASKALELIDLGRFIKDVAIDRDALKEAVESLVPEKAEEKAPPFGGGPRKTAGAPDPGPGLPRLRDAYAQSSK